MRAANVGVWVAFLQQRQLMCAVDNHALDRVVVGVDDDRSLVRPAATEICQLVSRVKVRRSTLPAPGSIRRSEDAAFLVAPPGTRVTRTGSPPDRWPLGRTASSAPLRVRTAPRLPLSRGRRRRVGMPESENRSSAKPNRRLKVVVASRADAITSPRCRLCGVRSPRPPLTKAGEEPQLSRSQARTPRAANGHALARRRRLPRPRACANRHGSRRFKSKRSVTISALSIAIGSSAAMRCTRA